MTEALRVIASHWRRLPSRLRRVHPALWLMLSPTLGALLANHRGRADKQSELRAINTQVSSGDDYHIAIVTTAALPWMTGTAVNPLLRAAHLARAGKRVTLLLPWLHPSEQGLVFARGLRFARPELQEEHIRAWLRERAKLPLDFRLLWYPGRYDVERGSILPLGDITRFFDADECDVAVLEEPEHLTWYHHGPNWRHRFKLVVGVVHTNYLYYAETAPTGGKALANTLKNLNMLLCRAYCDKVIKLSDTLQPLPRSVVSNVHGVRGDFLEIGRRVAARAPFRRFSGGAYFLGKVLWAKGHRLLLDYLLLQRELGLPSTHIDIYGSGEDLQAVVAEAARADLDVSFHGPTDHAGKRLREYKVFINPSQSEVLSTTTAEALAMGKFVVIQRHPSNEFFYRFANALLYDSPSEFLAQMQHALSTQPAPLTPEERRELSWEGATDRFLHSLGNCTNLRDDTATATAGDGAGAGAAAAAGSSSVSSGGSKVRDAVRYLLPVKDSDGDAVPLPSLADHTAGWVHQGLMQNGYVSDVLRHLSGGGPISRQSWLQAKQFRDASVIDIVEQSIALSPPAAFHAQEPELGGGGAPPAPPSAPPAARRAGSGLLRWVV